MNDTATTVTPLETLLEAARIVNRADALHMMTFLHKSPSKWDTLQQVKTMITAQDYCYLIEDEDGEWEECDNFQQYVKARIHIDGRYDAGAEAWSKAMKADTMEDLAEALMWDTTYGHSCTLADELFDTIALKPGWEAEIISGVDEQGSYYEPWSLPVITDPYGTSRFLSCCYITDMR